MGFLSPILDIGGESDLNMSLEDIPFDSDDEHSFLAGSSHKNFLEDVLVAVMEKNEQVCFTDLLPGPAHLCSKRTASMTFSHILGNFSENNGYSVWNVSN